MIGRYTDQRLPRLLRRPELVRAALANYNAPAAKPKRGGPRRRRRRVDLAGVIAASGNDLTLARVIREHIAYVLQIVDGNLSDAARLLGCNRRTLQRMARRRR